ncbi:MULTISPECIES: hypothetical protein [unclassified Paraburkholderia]|uniref:hypothetical protein n=1 Tax=unclassified Paraburkholderia TaxID=2615204 RepID=UPI0019815C56|nr:MULTISPECIES: hypothetical protein [unclassified Paraburkholderia]MBN3856908.1 hypothetical protein [Paraburkholderia sp. Ac-20340]
MREKGELARRLIAAMQDGASGTTSELAVRAQVDVRSVRAILRLWLDAGIVQVSEVLAPRRTLVYRYGDATPEAAGAAAVRQPRVRSIAEMPPDRWPQLDPDVAAAVDAMVRVSSREA